MGVTTVSRNNQITLPRDIRELLEIQEGDRLILRTEGGKILIEKTEKSPVEDSFGIWRRGLTGKEYTRKIRVEWQQRG